MKRLLLSICLLTSVIQTTFAKPIVPPETILKSFMSLLYYQRDYLRLSESFTALDVKGKPISKGQLLKQIATGEYLPLRMETKEAQACYQLYPSTEASSDIRSTLKQIGAEYYNYYKMEGTPLPSFRFTDLSGRMYTNQNTKGKTLVLKCWFINCHVCVIEIPELNELVKHYQKRNDILFVSLATDKAQPLKAFTKKHEFKYTVVPEQETYMEGKLKIGSYPTHFIVNPKGRIVKVISSASELKAALRQQLGS